jgi:hypothetical protein
MLSTVSSKVRGTDGLQLFAYVVILRSD